MKPSATRQKSKGITRAFLFLPFVFCLLLFVFAGDSWRFAERSYSFDFTRDQANHPDYRMEWWSYAGNLTAKDGRRFGYQLKFFRIGITLDPGNPSRWAVRDLFIAQLAVTDRAGNQFHQAERINRAGVGWAGADSERLRIWNEDWEARENSHGRHQLRAMENGIGIELELDRGKPPVAHGDGGYVQKGEFSVNATQYFSLPRMPTRGALVLNGERVEVEGLSWMDHEFGASIEEKEQAGWDRLCIQLDDGTDLMLYRFRRTDGARDEHSMVTMVETGGVASKFRFDQFVLEPLAQWRSTESGASYPIAWRVKLPGREMELTVGATVNNQEVRAAATTGLIWWSGTIEATGVYHGRQVRGSGVMEMTGYAGAGQGVLSE